MTCTRCHQEISFNEWFSQPCWQGDVAFYHSVDGDDLRAAYSRQLTEAAYSRSQM